MQWCKFFTHIQLLTSFLLLLDFFPCVGNMPINSRLFIYDQDSVIIMAKLRCFYVKWLTTAHVMYKRAWNFNRSEYVLLLPNETEHWPFKAITYEWLAICKEARKEEKVQEKFFYSSLSSGVHEQRKEGEGILAVDFFLTFSSHLMLFDWPYKAMEGVLFWNRLDFSQFMLTLLLACFIASWS